MLTSKPTDFKKVDESLKVQIGDKYYFNDKILESNIVKVTNVYQEEKFKLSWKKEWWGGYFYKEKISTKFVDLTFDQTQEVSILKINFEKIKDWDKVETKKKKFFWFW